MVNLLSDFSILNMYRPEMVLLKNMNNDYVMVKRMPNTYGMS